MSTVKTRCSGCGREGELEIIGPAARVGPDKLFRYLGHHAFTGNMYFRCPGCGWEVVVNPMELPGAPVCFKTYLPRFASTATAHGVSAVFKTAVSRQSNK